MIEKIADYLVEDHVALLKENAELRAKLADSTMRKATRDEKIVSPGVYEVPAEQAEQEPVGYVPQSVIDWLSSDERTDGAYSSINLYKNPCGSSDAPLYAAPVRTKDLTDDEIDVLAHQRKGYMNFARAVIAADREKNK